MWSSTFFYLTVIAYIAENSLGRSPNNCLCPFNDQTCTGNITNDAIFYYSAQFSCDRKQICHQKTVQTEGVVQCWNYQIQPEVIQIAKCNNSTEDIRELQNKTTLQSWEVHRIDAYNAITNFLVMCIDEENNNNNNTNQLNTSQQQQQTAQRLQQHFNQQTAVNFTVSNLISPERVKVLLINNVQVDFDEDILLFLPGLKILSMNGINISKIPVIIASTNLSKVDLSGNNIRDIPLKVFDSYARLPVRLLNLSYNHIECLGFCCSPTEVLSITEKWHSLWSLDLSHNQISTICFNFFEFAYESTSILLHNNEIRSLENVFLTDNNNIRVLNLTRNKLSKIFDADLSFLHSLIYLDLSSNEIKFIEKNAFKNINELNYISLDNNLLDFKEYSAPFFPSNLRNLSLNNNKLTSIPELDWKKLEIFRLHLMNNLISYVTPHDFSFLFKFKGRKRVYLQNNTIVTFDLHEYHTRDKSSTIFGGVKFYLDYNPLRCDCAVKSLREYLQTGFDYGPNFKIEFIANNLYCHQPQSLQHQLFKNIAKTFLHCSYNEYCPSSCRCSFDEYETVVNCEESDLIHIPYNLPPNTTSLTLSYNPLETLQILHMWEYIEFLTIDHIPNLESILKSEDISFSSMTNLKLLSLQHCNLTVIPLNSMTTLKNLTTLKLAYNALKTLPNLVFLSLPRLKRIFVSNNNIYNLDKSVFETNTELETIDIHCNNLSNFNLNISHLNNLTFLDISTNSLREILATWPENIKSIILSVNNISSFNFLNLPLALQYLDFSYNQIDFLDIDKLQNFEDKVIFDFSNNNISRLSFKSHNLNFELSPALSPTTIILNSNPLSCDCTLNSFLSYLKQNLNATTPMQYFFQAEELYCNFPVIVKNKKLIDLDSSQLPCGEDYCAENCLCFKLQSVDYRSMECLNFPQSAIVYNITALHIVEAHSSDVNKLASPQWNSVREITIKNLHSHSVKLLPNLFSNFTKLTAIIITNDQNLTLTDFLFSGLSNLLHLDLSHDGITTLYNTTFAEDVELQYLNLSYNFLNRLQSGTFRDLTKLQTLDLSNNKLALLDKQLFTNSKNLKNLFLQHNTLQYLDKDIFSQCQLLKKLDLSFNLLATNTMHSLFIPPKITHLDVSNNRIKHIEKSWTNLRDLKKLDLSFNEIQKLNLQRLIYFPLSSSIYLRNNNISEIDELDNILTRRRKQYTFDELDDGTITVWLGNNPFKCDCNLNQFISILKTDSNIPLRVADGDKLRCSQPSNLKDKALLKISLTDLYCHLSVCPVGCDCTQQYHYVVVNCNLTDRTNIYQCPYRIDVLKLSGNLHGKKFQNLCWRRIQELYISNNFLIADTHNFLKTCNRLKVLSIQSSRLDTISFEMFHPLPKLEVIDFSNNQIKTRIWEIPETLHSLNLAHNQIESFEASFIVDFKLENLNLSYNKLLELSYLHDLKNLKMLDLSYNNIVINCNEASLIFPRSLQSLNISHNKLTCTDFLDRDDKAALAIEYLDVSYNPISLFQLNNFLYGNNTNVTVNLKNCSISVCNLVLNGTISKIWNSALIIDVTNNPKIECDCDITNYDSFNATQNQNVSVKLIASSACNAELFHLNLRKEYSLLPNIFMCSIRYKCPFHCLCLNWDNAIHVYCVNLTLNSLPSKSPINSEYLNLDFNNITELGGLNEPQWKNLKEISVRFNKITTLLDENLSTLFSLRAVYLDGNRLSSPSGWLSNFVKNNVLPFHLSLSGNPWSCSCDNKKFQSWIMDFSKTQFILDNWNITCSNGDLLLNFDMCPSEIWKTLLPILLVLIVVVVIFSLTVFYYRKKTIVLAWVYSKNLCSSCVDEDDIDVDKEFDAFLSYAEEDSEYVMDVLLPGLEDNEPFYKICVHERDWSAGQSIIEQIELSIKNSRRVIFVLSQHFVQSMWANLEFKFANFQSVQDKVNRIIVIVLNENFEVDELDEEFRTHLSMNTYLKSSDFQFWNKLRFAMPKKRSTRKKHHRKSAQQPLVESEETQM